MVAKNTLPLLPFMSLPVLAIDEIGHAGVYISTVHISTYISTV